MSPKFVDSEKLEKLAKALNSQSSTAIKNEEERAMSAETGLQNHIIEVKDMFDGKSIKYITQEQYDQLTEEEKDDPFKTYFITDAVDLSHEHANKDFLDELSPEVIDNKANKIYYDEQTHEVYVECFKSDFADCYLGYFVNINRLNLRVDQKVTIRFNFETQIIESEFNVIQQDDIVGINAQMSDGSYDISVIEGRRYNDDLVATIDENNTMILVISNTTTLDTRFSELISLEIFTTEIINATKEVDSEFLKTHKFITESEKIKWNNKADKLTYRTVQSPINLINENTQILTNGLNQHNIYLLYAITNTINLVEGALYLIEIIGDNYFYSTTVETSVIDYLADTPFLGLRTNNNEMMFAAIDKFDLSNSTYNENLCVLQVAIDINIDLQISQVRICLIEEEEVNNEFLTTNRFITEDERIAWNNKANKTGQNIFNGEQKMINADYCPEMNDVASGVGCSLKNVRALDNQLITAEIYAPYNSMTDNRINMTSTKGELPIYKIDKAEAGAIVSKTQLARFTSEGIYEGTELLEDKYSSKLIYESTEPEPYVIVDSTNIIELEPGLLHTKQIDKLNLEIGKEYVVTFVQDNESSSSGIFMVKTISFADFTTACLTAMYDLVDVNIIDGVSLDTIPGNVIQNENAAVVVITNHAESDSISLDFESIIIESVEKIKTIKEVDSEFLKTHKFVTESEKIKWNNKADKLFYNIEGQSNVLQFIDSQTIYENGEMSFAGMAQQLDLVSGNKYKIKITDDNGKVLFTTIEAVAMGLITSTETYDFGFINNFNAINPQAPANTSFVQFLSKEFISINKIEIIDLIEYEVNNEFLETYRFITEEEKEYWNNKVDKNYVDAKTSTIDALTLNGYSLWIGTTTDLEAIAQKDPNTLYFEIDDDTEDEVVQVDVVNGALTLTANKYQKTNMINGAQIVFPEVNKFTEIHLYFRANDNMSISFPSSAKLRVEPNIEEGKSYEIVCTYNTIEWLVNIIVYS